MLCSRTSCIVGSGKKKRQIALKPIYNALGEEKVNALPGFHAFTGSDTTGAFAGKGKLSCWKAFQQCDTNILQAFANLGLDATPSNGIFDALERFVCKLYMPNCAKSDVGAVRFTLFQKKIAESEKMPPTQSALRYAILRAHYQAMVCLLYTSRCV